MAYVDKTRGSEKAQTEERLAARRPLDWSKRLTAEHTCTKYASGTTMRAAIVRNGDFIVET